MKPLAVVWRPVARVWRALRTRIDHFLARRPHRSFRTTRRRDYVRPLQMPGYWSFTGSVFSMLWKHKKMVSGLLAVYAVLTVTFVGLASQETYTQLSETLQATGGNLFEGQWGQVGQASLLLLGGVSGSLATAPTPAQQIYAGLLILLMWLTIVWLLRAIMAGQRPRLRDGIYNAGAPLVPMFLVSLLLIVQLLPVALAAIGYGAAVATDLLSGGVEAMLFWAVAGLMVCLSLYWVTSTLFALIVVTLPGMYPMRAIRTAGDLVAGRRLRILYRLMWMGLLVAVAWVVVVVPIILFATWLNTAWPATSWMPIVPLALLIMSALSLVWTASYVYLLYRKVVDDDAAPA
ncbi:MAG: hypothetical protein ABIR91_02265 [Candidatus Saccharimonadales bacterium]